MQRTILLTLIAALALPLAQAGPLENHSGVTLGGDGLLEAQLESGAMPWIVGNPGEYQNVQGISAMGLLEAYKLTGDAKYLEGAGGVHDWLADYMAADEDAYISSSNIYFLAEYGLLTLDLGDLDLARDAMGRAMERFGGAQELVDYILTVRANTYGNMGVWDVALFIRAAQDIGATTLADDLTTALLTTEIVDLFDNTTNYYELGLSGVLFGLAESDLAGHADVVAQAQSALLATQCDNGSFPTTWRGAVYCDDVQTTAYSVIGLSMAFDVVAIQASCDFLVDTQNQTTGGWDVGGYEIAEINSEAVMALAACIAPVNNGATSYVDAARDLL